MTSRRSWRGSINGSTGHDNGRRDAGAGGDRSTAPRGPAIVIEVLVGGGLVIAAVALIRRSRWAVIFAASVQLVVALDAVRRIVRDLAVAPPIALLVLAALASLAVLAPATRAWCDEPIRPSKAR